MKIIRSNRGGRYYGKYDESAQHPGPFAKLLQKSEIFHQYTMPEIVKIIMSNSNLQISLWMHAPMNVVYIFNKVTRCPAEARIYNPHKKKLDPKTISGFYIRYLKKSKGYRFYSPNHSTRIVEIGNARFIENDKLSGSDEVREVVIREIRTPIRSLCPYVD
ncbi:hypothetical protein V2J09_003742 [Rumex salicifolius]